MKKKGEIEIIATNRRARFDYEILETYTAGIVLLGPEIKSIRLKHVNMNSGFAKVENEEVFLYGMQISPYEYNTIHNIDEFRKRKLLLKKREIKRLKSQTEKKGYSIIPLEIFLKNGWAKIKLAVGKGRKKFDKKEYLKEKDIEKQTRRELNY
ncbi:MAG: SsrA-binding protein SmpB [Elusimicrobiota bacterium]